MKISLGLEKFVVGMKMACLFIFIIFFSLSGIALAADGDPINGTLYPIPGHVLEVQMAIDKPTYSPGENIIIFADKTLTSCVECFESVNTEFSYKFGSNPWVIFADDDSSANSYVDVLVAPSTPGTYSLDVSARSYTNYMGFFNQDSAGGPITFTVAPPPTGNITVSSNNPAANWTITGPIGVPLTGSGLSATYTNQPTGTYTITWGAVSGQNPPGSTSFTLTTGGTLTFPPGNYTPIVAPSVNLNFI